MPNLFSLIASIYNYELQVRSALPSAKISTNLLTVQTWVPKFFCHSLFNHGAWINKKAMCEVFVAFPPFFM